MKKLPTISIIVVTLNNELTLETCLTAIRSQDYPIENIEYIGVDGGSVDRTKEIFKKHGFRVIASPYKRDAEAQRAVGLSAAKNDIIISIDADNFLPTNQWFRQMVQPFMDDPTVVHANTMRYTYRKSDSIFNRYCALFGMADPIVFYVGRPDRIPYYQKNWTLGTIIKDTNDYVTVDFTPESLPTVGCNGVAYRRDVLLKYARSKPNEFLHIDVFVDIMSHGFHRFAIVKNSVIHYTAVTLTRLMQKRVAFLSSYFLKKDMVRRYAIFNPKKFDDKVKLLLFVLYTVTLIKPLIDAMRGFVVVRDVAWFVHPFMCWVYLLSYGLATIKRIGARHI